MKRIPCVDWFNTLKKEYPDEEGDYLVAMDNGNNEYDMQKASWMKKGSVVYLEKLVDDTDTSSLTIDERLLRTIFGPTEKVIIKKDGFYLVTGAYGEQDEHPGCRCGVFECGDCYWCELPQAPNNGMNQKEIRRRNNAKKEAAKREMAERHYKESMDFASDKPYVKNAMRRFGITENTDTFDSMEISTHHGGIYKMEAWELARTITDAAKIPNAFNCLDKDKYLEMLQDKDKSKEAAQMVRDSFKDGMIKHELMQIFISTVFESKKPEGKHTSVYMIRNKELKKCNNHANAIIISDAKCKVYSRIMRFANVLKIAEMPDIFWTNELCTLTKSLISTSTRYLIGYTDTYGSHYGVTPNGEKYIYPDIEEDDDEITDDSDSEIEILTDDECKYDDTERNPGVIGIDFPYLAVNYTPNWLFWKGNYCIFDNEKLDYFVDPDMNDIKVFNSINEAKEYKIKMDSKLGH